MSGRTSVHSHLHFQKRFDLLERVLPQLIEEEPLSAAAFRRWHLERSLHAMGAATDTDLRMYLTFPRSAAGERAATLREMIRSGEFAAEQAPPGASWGPVSRRRGIAGLAAAVRSLAKFTGAERVHAGRVTPSSLRDPLRRALR
jgi:uncharacterized protein YcaQ